MKIELEIDDGYLKEMVANELAERIVKNYSYENQDAKYGIKYGTEKAIKEYIYSRKDEIIDKVINRASTEIVKKGMPKLFDKMMKGDEE